MKFAPRFEFFSPLSCQLGRNSISQPKRYKIRSAFLFPVRQIASRSLDLGMLIEWAKCRRWHRARGSGLQTRWAHRLQAYVPEKRAALARRSVATWLQSSRIVSDLSNSVLHRIGITFSLTVT